MSSVIKKKKKWRSTAVPEHGKVIRKRIHYCPMVRSHLLSKSAWLAYSVCFYNLYISFIFICLMSYTWRQQWQNSPVEAPPWGIQGCSWRCAQRADWRVTVALLLTGREQNKNTPKNMPAVEKLPQHPIFPCLSRSFSHYISRTFSVEVVLRVNKKKRCSVL